MAIEVEGLDVELLRSEIQRTYADVSRKPNDDARRSTRPSRLLDERRAGGGEGSDPIRGQTSNHATGV